MLLAIRERLIATILILGSVSAYPGSVLALSIDGDCNVVAPRVAVTGSVTYQINCNNISEHASDKIEKILKIIEKSSRDVSGSEFERALDRISKTSSESLELIKQGRSPRIELSARKFKICDSCYDDVEFINVGGFVERVETFDLLEIVGVELQIGKSRAGGDLIQCPFKYKKAFDSAVAFIDYNTAGYGSWIGQSREPGEMVGYFGVSNSYSGKRVFENEVFSNYNEKRELKRKRPIKLSTFNACVNFSYQLAVKIGLVNSTGQQYEQYYLLAYKNIDDKIIELVDIFPYGGAKGFKQLSDKHQKLEESRRFQRGEVAQVSVLSEFMLERSK